MKNKPTYRFLFLVYMGIAALLLTSCIKEDRSNCPVPGTVLSIVFTDPYAGGDPLHGLNTGEFPHANIFIYEESGQLVHAGELSSIRLGSEYKLSVQLMPGNYKMTVWIGAASYYGLHRTGIFEQASLELNIPQNSLVEHRIDHLYYGHSDFQSDGTVASIPLIQFTNDINCTITGLDSNGSYKVMIEDTNGKYGFDGGFLPCERFIYASEVLISGEDHTSLSTILRLGPNRIATLSLIDALTGELLYPSYEGQQTNLVELIKMAYQNNAFDFDSRHRFNLTLEFDARMRATVYIDDWEVKDNEYEI